MSLLHAAPTRFATAADGCPIAYALTEAAPGAPRVALVHSLALDRSFWGPVVEAADGAFAFLALDCRGHGESGSIRPFTASLMADDMATALDHAGWDRAIIAGASMGGSVSLAFAARHTARCAALLAIDTTAWYGDNAPTDWLRRAGVARQGGMAALLEFQRARWLSDEFRLAHPEVQAAQEAVFLRMDLESYTAACAMLGVLDLRAAISGLKLPTAVLVGEEDGATPPHMAQDIAERIPGATFDILPGARHLTPLERPQDIVAALKYLAGI